MKSSISLAVAGIIALIAGAAVWRTNSLLSRDLGTLSPQVDVMASAWDARKVPIGQRAVTIVLSDAGAEFDPFLLAPQAEAGFIEASGGWIRRSLIGGNPASQSRTALVRAFFGSPQMIAWTHNGFAAAGEAAMARELEKAILKAHDAGAEINVVAQGKASGPVLLALKRVQGMERGGSKVGANKVILLGMSASRLAAGFAKPANVNELANIWSTRERGSRMRMQVFNGNRAGETLDLEELWPGLGEGGDPVAKCALLVREFTESPDPLDRFISRQEELRHAALARWKAEEEARSRALAAEQARAAPAVIQAQPPARNTPVTRPASSAGAVADANRWPSTGPLDYATSMNGVDIGWLFSAPADIIEDLRSETTQPSLANRSGLSKYECSQHLHLKAVSIEKLEGGNRGAAAFKALWTNESRGTDAGDVGSVSRLKIHGYPASVFKATQPGGRGMPSETAFLVVETGPHLIYFVLTSYFAPEVREACLDSYMPLYQGIAGSIRPNPGR